jgi:hypothetical protein
MGTGDLETVGMVMPLIGHLGGIDEIGIFLVPALLAIFALRWAEKRARERAASEGGIADDQNESAFSPQAPVASEDSKPVSGDW